MRTAIVAIVFLLNAANVSAQESVWRSWTLDAQVGVLSPTGYAGIQVGYSLTEAFAVVVGAGLSSDDFEHAGRVAIGARLRPVRSAHNAFALESWLSVGPYTELNLDVDYEGPQLANWNALVMWHVLPTWELQRDSGFRFRAFAGASGNFFQRASNRDCGTCTNGRKLVIWPTTGISLGVAFQ